MNSLELCDRLSQAEQAQTEYWCDVLDAAKALDRLHRSFEQNRNLMDAAMIVDFLNEVRAEFQIFGASVDSWQTARAMCRELTRELDMRVLG